MTKRGLDDKAEPGVTLPVIEGLARNPRLAGPCSDTLLLGSKSKFARPEACPEGALHRSQVGV